MDYDEAIDSLVVWAQQRPEVRVLVLTGSAASGSAHPLSDRDIQVFTTDIPVLVDDESWWNRLGEVIVVERLKDGDDNPTRLVYYAGGKIDFTLLPADDFGRAVYNRPFDVLLDKDGKRAQAALRNEPDRSPTQVAFDESIHWAWAAALMTAKAIVRDEPWSAKLRDQDLKAELLRMIEWDHRTRYGMDYDTRYLGTRMRTWMDADVQRAVEGCWSGVDSADSTRALLATTDLYRRLAERTAKRLDFSVFGHERAADELRTILQVARATERVRS